MDCRGWTWSSEKATCNWVIGNKRCVEQGEFLDPFLAGVKEYGCTVSGRSCYSLKCRGLLTEHGVL